MAVCAPPISGRRSRRCSCRNDPRMADGDVFWRRRSCANRAAFIARQSLLQTAAPVRFQPRAPADSSSKTPGQVVAIWRFVPGTIALARRWSVRKPVLGQRSAWLPRPRLRDISFCSCEYHSPAAGLMTYGRIRPARNPRPAAFFPAACGGSSRPLRFKKAARSGPPLPLRPSGFSRPRRAHHGPPSQGNGPRREQKETFK